MDTPIYDFIKTYKNSNLSRLHMPGHKGIKLDDELSIIYNFDITEIKGADSLFEADGIIKKSEANATALFKTESTFYSTQGSTLCIQSMLFVMKQEKRKVIAVRNVHRGFLNACALLDIDVSWVYPEYKNSLISARINIDEIEKKLKSIGDPSCVYITSPDYFGNIQDVKKISVVCKKYGAVLLVDNAHGACLSFMDSTRHPIHLGADMCADSAHKTLPVLTGGAYLHVGNKLYINKIKSAMSVFASTSPSYLIMASLDLCNKYIYYKLKEDINKTTKNIENLIKVIEKNFDLYNDEIFHVTINAYSNGYSGFELYDYLSKYNIECEYVDEMFLVLLFSPLSNEMDFEKLTIAFENIIKRDGLKIEEEILFPEMKKALTIRQACFSDYEEIDIYKSEGKICANLKVSCPPAIPIAVSGEIISKECIKLFEKYRIFTINVLK